MSHLAEAIWVEALKARRSRMPIITVLGFLLIPLAGGFFMIILKDPELARRAGLITSKARVMAGVVDWPTYLGLLSQAVAVGGIVLFGLIGIWVFGREYSDRTVKDLLALPTSRSTIVFGKFIVIAVWSVALVALIGVAGLVIGAAVGLPPVPVQVITDGAMTMVVCAVLAVALVAPIAFFASAGHGYLPPLGVMILAIFLSQIVSVTGRGEYFPWSIPAMYSQGLPLGAISYVIVLVTGVAGLAGTFLWWELADQTH